MNSNRFRVFRLQTWTFPAEEKVFPLPRSSLLDLQPPRSGCSFC